MKNEHIVAFKHVNFNLYITIDERSGRENIFRYGNNVGRAVDIINKTKKGKKLKIYR